MAYEIILDIKQISVNLGGLWIRRTGQALAEAMILAVGHLLDLEFNKICRILI